MRIPFLDGHPRITLPSCGTLSALVQVVQVVHVLVGFHLERVQAVPCIGAVLALAPSLPPIAQVETVEAPPGVARRLCLPQVYHLVVLDRCQP